MTDTSIAAVELLACELPDTHWQAQRLHRAALTLRALSAQLEAANQRAYSLAYAIAGGEDVPGLLDSVNTDELCKMLKSQRAWAQDAEFSARAEGKAKGLRDAAACLGHITRFEDLDAILALIPADLSPTPAQIMADPRVAALVDALDRIAHASNVYGVEANAEDQGAETLAYAHKSTCNLARAALAQLKGPKP